MGDQETVDQILDFIPTIDFTKTATENETISVFESTIRYLGGLVSGKLFTESLCVKVHSS